jgi:hypothetical protein
MTGSHLFLPSYSGLVRVGIVAGPGRSAWNCISHWRYWIVAWTASATKALVVNNLCLFSDINPSLLQTSSVSFILCEEKMPGPSAFWWSSASKLQLMIALRDPKKLRNPPVGWVDHLIPWNHVLCGGITAAFELIHIRS